jgi:hypothetical protein
MFYVKSAIKLKRRSSITRSHIRRGGLLFVPRPPATAGGTRVKKNYLSQTNFIISIKAFLHTGQKLSRERDFIVQSNFGLYIPFST